MQQAKQAVTYSTETPSNPQGFAMAQEWLTKPTKSKQATLGIVTDQEARKLQEVGQQVSTLDGTSSKEGEARTEQQARQIESQYRNVVNKVIFQPRPIATASDQGQAGIS